MVCATGTFAQSDSSRHGGYTREIELVAENDYFFYEDYYYTAGQDIVYRRLVDPRAKLHKLFKGNKDSAKVIVQYRAGVKIFNSFNIESPFLEDQDRPYAGWSYVQTGVTSFRRPRSGNFFAVETGIVGKKSGMENLQKWVHKVTGYDAPEGWGYQISNEWLVNLYYTRFQNWRLAEDADIVSQSSVQLGTGGNKFSQDVTLRLIDFNEISNSAFTQSRLSWDKASDKKRPDEIYIFVGFGVDYVISNVYTEGSLFKNPPSVFTVPAVPWVYRSTYGITYSNRKVSCSAIFYHLTKEVAAGKVHDYASLRLGIRF